MQMDNKSRHTQVFGSLDQDNVDNETALDYYIILCIKYEIPP